MGKAILVIDDEEAIRKSFVLALEETEYQMDTAESGEMGVEMEKEGKYDLIFLDLKMPGLSGVESLRAIKRFQPEVRCFLLTGYSADHDSLKGIEAGAAEILTKPVNPEELSRRLAAGPEGNR